MPILALVALALYRLGQELDRWRCRRERDAQAAIHEMWRYRR